MKNPTWKIIHIGQLKQNRYWDEEEICRAQVCTSTLIETSNRRIFVDPGLAEAELLRQHLFDRAGLRPEDIDTVFLTHFHRTHWQSVGLFHKSVWLMSRTEIRWWERRSETSEEERNLLARIVPFEDHSLREIEILPTSGHTHGAASLMFETREGMVVVAGDAILTFDHFDHREPSANAEDYRESRRSIDQIAKVADIVIPGHGNFFVV